MFVETCHDLLHGLVLYRPQNPKIPQCAEIEGHNFKINQTTWRAAGFIFLIERSSCISEMGPSISKIMKSVLLQSEDVVHDHTQLSIFFSASFLSSTTKNPTLKIWSTLRNYDVTAIFSFCPYWPTSGSTKPSEEAPFSKGKRNRILAQVSFLSRLWATHRRPHALIGRPHLKPTSSRIYVSPTPLVRLFKLDVMECGQTPWRPLLQWILKKKMEKERTNSYKKQVTYFTYETNSRYTRPSHGYFKKPQNKNFHHMQETFLKKVCNYTWSVTSVVVLTNVEKESDYDPR